MPEAPSHIRVVTYNIHRCVGRDGRKDPLRIASVLQQLSGDIIGLQEVDSSRDAASGERTTSDPQELELIARACRCASVAGPTMAIGQVGYGNALLTTGEILETRKYIFEDRGHEPRGLLDVQIGFSGLRVRALVTHLGLRSRERREQVSKILEIVDGAGERVLVLLGDFNEWNPWARDRRRLSHRFGAGPILATFPAWRPILPLDHIWVRPRSALVSLAAVATGASRVASDHLPLLAGLRLRRSRTDLEAETTIRKRE